MDPQQLIIQYFDKALLGLAGLWLVVAGVGMTSPLPELQKTESLGEIGEKVEAYIKKHKPKKVPTPDWRKDVIANLKSEGVPTTEAFPAWSSHNRPNLIYSFIISTGVQDPVHSEPVDLSLTPTRGKISVSWAESSENVLVRIEKYEVQRAEGESQSFTTIAELDADATDYVDVNVKPRREYSYRVISTAALDSDHPQVQRMILKKLIKPTLKKKLQVKTSSVAGPVKMPRTTIVVPKGIIKPTTDEELAALRQGREPPYKATIRVYRWDPDIPGNWVYQDYFQVQTGADIGRSNVKKKGKVIDFAIGKLKSCELKTKADPQDKTRQIEWQMVTIEYKDGSTETFNNIQVPDEVKDVK